MVMNKLGQELASENRGRSCVRWEKDTPFSVQPGIVDLDTQEHPWGLLIRRTLG